jgi:ectoine hydroxylase-related dioxygenase (phytanoyl-CoA dioxygenase family)
MDFVEQFERDNFLVVTRLFDPSLIDAAASEFDRQFGDIDPDALPPHMRVGPRRVQLPIQLKGPLLDPALYANPLLLRMLEPLLGKHFLLDSISVVVALPGAPQQRLHRDHDDLFMERQELRALLRPYAITVTIPLVDFTEETGATRLFPGSQAIGGPAVEEQLADAEGMLCYVARGGCTLMDFRVIHRGTENRSEEMRPMLALIYTRAWFTDSENFNALPRIAIAPEDVAKIPAEHRPLFRRLAAKGSMDWTQEQLLDQSW